MTSAPRVNQVLVGAGTGDAITGMARTIRHALRERGPSNIYAHYIAPEVSDDVSSLAALPAGRRQDIIVYHASYGSPEVTRRLLTRPERIVLVYHNITPSKFYLEHEPDFAAGLQWGRHEIGLLRDRVALAIADSAYNAVDLEGEGFADVHVVPAGLRPTRLRQVAPDGSLASELVDRFPSGFVLGVSQVLPHKRFDTLVDAMHLVEWVHELELGLVIVGSPRMPLYVEALHRHARQLGMRRVWIAGGATDAALATFFRMARLFVSTSAHEGLALPPLEAMSFGVPVVARAAGAVAATVGTAGVVLPEDAGPMLFSEAIAEVHLNEDLRFELVRRGEARVNDVEAEDPAERFTELLDGLIR